MSSSNTRTTTSNERPTRVGLKSKMMGAQTGTINTTALNTNIVNSNVMNTNVVTSGNQTLSV